MYQKILVPVDDSPISRQAFYQALSLAQAFSCSLHLLHVISPPSMEYQDPTLIAFGGGFYPGMTTEALQETWSTIEDAGIKLLQDFCQEGQEVGVMVEFTQKSGDINLEIAEFAKNWGADLIVIGSHGRKGLNEWLFGSVSNYVSHHVPCSVLLVHEH